MPRKNLHFVKVVRARGRVYHYFNTGVRDEKGKQIFARLPSPSDPSYGATYAGYLGGRSQRAALAERLTVPTLMDLYEKSPVYRALSQTTQDLYSWTFREWRRLMPSAPADGIDASDVTRVMDKLAETPAKANLMLGALGAVYRWARRRGHVANEPTRGVERLPVNEWEPWPEHVLAAGLASPDRTFRLAVHLLYYTAQRIGDVAKMRWSDLDGARLTLTQQKTGKALSLPIHAALLGELARTPRNSLMILSDDQGRPIPAKRMSARMTAFGKEHGVRIVAHGLRKNAVNALLEAGCSAAETAAVSGQSLQMVEHYAKRRSQSRLSSAAVLKWEKNK